MMNSHLVVPDEIKQHLSGEAFSALMQMPGKAYRDVRGRKTIQVKLGKKSYFIKQHFGVGWAEIFKNLIAFKKPILGAMTEVHAIQKLNAIGIPTTPLVAYGQQGCNPATMQSFVMTEDLGEIVTLEDICADWPSYSDGFKQALMQAMAELASKLHGAGLCHRDFYLCHFVLKKQDLDFKNSNIKNLHLIDLHRMLQGQSSSGNAVMKDIAGLYFSALQCGLSTKELDVFKQHYLPQNTAFWAKVERRAQALLTKFNSQKFQQRLQKEKSAIR
ncbi:lipopolysaccharide core heptose(I) kinase RfaP [Methylotenera versatilis]|uniref:lipopolysaccharide core heptose(I) kinase RfaP n=1 Tax=Methylotenera versatilis TaxID=1055487 RepID=UPI000AD379A1|nr:lipopolysaccharide core heptose(I) kinase RfaP [Methylotenera versatilis]